MSTSATHGGHNEGGMKSGERTATRSFGALFFTVNLRISVYYIILI